MNENQNPNHLNDEDPFGLNSTFDTFFGDILEERADGDHIPPSVANEAAKMTTEYVTILSLDYDSGEYFEEKVTRQEYDRLVAAGVYKPAGAGTEPPAIAPKAEPQFEYIKLWRTPDKREARVYIKTRDGREGCLYATGNPWNKKGSREGKVTAAEWKAAAALCGENWRTIYF